ncbi:MAG: hypothetical protein LBS19_14345 [Clostridiales bacterium]|jgi:hypothetical protein|nr:hypothetical protein [Clostridiales bacterium]
MKTIKQLSNELGISKEAIYKKLKFQLRDELTGHVFKVDSVTRIDEEGERLIRRSLHHERRAAIETVMGGVIDVELVDGPSAGGIDGQAHLTEYVNLLRDQVKEKDIQIETQSGHIGQLIRQLGVFQLLTQNKRLNELAAAQAKDASEAAKQHRPAVRKSILHRIFGGKRKATQ